MRRRPALALLAAAAAGVTACAPIVELEPGDPVAFVHQPQTSSIAAADGQVLAELHAEQDRQDIPLDEMGELVVQAVVSLEDRRFFLHRGVDVAAIVRAALRNVETGGIEQGGSTITQQYVKNTMTGPARTLDRKLKEAALAYQLEQRYSKTEILERYLNTIYFGHGAYGVRAAAQRYFGRPPSRLDVSEAALLAGLIASPSAYDPYTDPDAALARRRTVLAAMQDTGTIGAEQARTAAEAPLRLAPLEPDGSPLAPYVVAEAKRLIQHDPDGRFGVLGTTVDERADALFTGGLRITTTVDLRLQHLAERAVTDVLEDPEDPDAAVVALDPTTGAIRALVGGRDHDDPEHPTAQFNLATQGRRQPGSAFKPVMLATALARGVKLDRVFPGGACVDLRPRIDWAPCNYEHHTYGPLTLRDATVHSVNTVYARLVSEIGPEALVQTARNLGFRGPMNPAAYANVLGTVDVSPLEMAGAYSVFADLGHRHVPYLIERIETADGELLYQHDPTDFEVIDPAVAYLVNQTLQDVVARGTGVRASIDRPQAGKTGTAQENWDAWFVGYTPDLVASVWVGFPEGQVPMRPPRTREVVEGGRWPAEIWKRFAQAALADTPPSPFPVPDVALVRVEVDVTRNCLPNPYTPPELIEVREYLAGTAPTQRCTEPTGPPIDDVPAVAGLPFDVAQRLLEDRGFVLDVRPEASKLYPPGIVTRQRPGPGGTTLPSDDHAVVVWVATTVKVSAPVPDVTGEPLEQAVRALEDGGWVVEWQLACPAEGCPDGAAAGRVWAQSPEPETIERQHSLIVLQVVPDA